MEFPFTEVELISGKEQVEKEKESNLNFRCEFCDVEAVYKIAEALLPGLASACVDNTSGGLLWSPGLVASNLKSEIQENLTQRSESHLAESVLLQGEAADNPVEIISDFIDDFASSKRNLFSRVSGWLLSDSREDKIDDFVQEMETNGFWPMNRREALSQILLKNVDAKNAFHCGRFFNSSIELDEHLQSCKFRATNCGNEGCTATFSDINKEDHDLKCPFKLIPCEQKCGSHIRRHDMDRHCLTVCAMKLVSCPFYGVGCQSNVPFCKLHEHLRDVLQPHLLLVLKRIHRGESMEFVNGIATLLTEGHAHKLSEADDIRALTAMVKELEETMR